MTSVVTTLRRGVNASRAVKVPVKAATTANITLSGEQTIDGISCVTGDRVLVKDQTDASENGIYDVDSSSWNRSADWDGTSDIMKGTYVYAANGSIGNNFWQVTTADPITIGTTEVAFQATDPDSLLRSNLADTANGQGASLVGVEDSAGNFSGATVEAVLAEIMSNLASTSASKGSSLVGVQDSAGYFTATTVEAALAEIYKKTLVKGADVASATALTLGTDGNYFDITGTTTITSIGTLGVGRIVKLHFDGALILTHHATDLVLLGSANITTAAGDEAEFVEYATGDWRMTNYQRASGVPVSQNGTLLTLGSLADLTNGGSNDLSNYTFTGIPSWVQRVTLMIKNVSSSAAATCLFQLGDAGGIETTGYLAGSGTTSTGGSNSATQDTTGFNFTGSLTVDTDVCHGQITFTLMDASTNQWSAHGEFHSSTGIATSTHVSGIKPLSDTLTQIDINVSTGTFDGGEASIMYE